MRTGHSILKLVVVLAVAMGAPAARASDNVECVTSTGKWNAPTGALVLSKSTSTGPVAAVITAIGETFTHSVVSHGPDYGSMDTMKEPRSFPSGSSSCNAPADPGDLANGWPGARTDNAGGLWGYYFSNGGFMNGQSDLRYIVAGTGKQYCYNGTTNCGIKYDSDVANCIGNWMKQDLAGSSGCGSNSPGPACSGPLPYGYSVYAYTQYQNSPSGYGTMCSGLISRGAYWSQAGIGGSVNYNGSSSTTAYCMAGGTAHGQTSYTYNNAQIVAASNGLYNNIANGSWSFWNALGTTLLCFDTNLLDEAADQVVNCFTNYQGTWCSQADHNWAYNNVYGHTATSISPDRLGGYYPHWNATNNNSPWKPYASAPVAFNQPGNTYGCWF